MTRRMSAADLAALRRSLPGRRQPRCGPPDPSDDPVEQFGSATPWSGSGIGASAPADITN